MRNTVIEYCCLLFGLAVISTSGLEVKLTVEERLGLARRNEPVTSGVPLPKGAVKDTTALRLLDENGKVVPVQFGVANRWWDDGSIKWLHVDFQPSVPANGKHFSPSRTELLPGLFRTRCASLSSAMKQESG
ncbi:MAG: RIFT barrel domain-containing protein [Kiritimatiellia bacterium]